MQQSVRQEQEPLDDIFNRKREQGSSKNSELDDLFAQSSSKGPVSKPSLRPAAGSKSSEKQHPKLVDPFENPKLSFDDDYVDFNDDEELDYDLASTLYDIMETGTGGAIKDIFKDIKRFVTLQAGSLRDMDISSMGQTALDTMENVKPAIGSLTEQESLLRTLTSAALICYGGSWAQLASIFAAVEAFGTKDVLEEAMEVFQNFITAEPDEENDVTPRQIKETFQKLGLQVALMIAVMFSPSWAEVCIAVSFAAKLIDLIPMEDILSRALSVPDMSMTSELEEWFQVVDDEWFSLLSLLACNIFSLTLFGCFPAFVTAMYMGIIGLEALADSMAPTLEFVVPLGDMSVPVCSFERSDLFSKASIGYVWGLNVFMSLWQAYCGYTGTFQFLSWLMFMLPIVKVANVLSTGEWSDKME